MCLSVCYPPITRFGGYCEASLCPYYCEADSKAHPAQEVCRKRWRLSRGPADSRGFAEYGGPDRSLDCFPLEGPPCQCIDLAPQLAEVWYGRATGRKSFVSPSRVDGKAALSLLTLPCSLWAFI